MSENLGDLENVRLVKTWKWAESSWISIIPASPQNHVAVFMSISHCMTCSVKWSQTTRKLKELRIRSWSQIGSQDALVGNLCFLRKTEKRLKMGGSEGGSSISRTKGLPSPTRSVVDPYARFGRCHFFSSIWFDGSLIAIHYFSKDANSTDGFCTYCTYVFIVHLLSKYFKIYVDHAAFGLIAKFWA